MIKKAIILLMGILLIVSAAFADETPATIQAMTELGEIQEKLDQGITIGKVYYTDGYGFSTSEFTTDDPEEIEQLWKAVNAITVEKRVDESITDWYPQIVFCLTDGTRGSVCFEGRWLCIGGMENYEISNAEGFWNLTAFLVEKHEEMGKGAIPAGWNADSGRTILPKETVMVEVPEGKYCIGVKDAEHLEEGYLILSLYGEMRYDRDEIENMKPGDRVVVNGETYTVGFVQIHGMYDSDGDGDPDLSCVFVKDLNQEIRDLLDRHELVVDGDFSEAPDSFVLTSYELCMTEEFYGYIAFEPVSETECRSVVNDWSPCEYLMDVTVPLPLPDDFIFLDYLDNELNAEAFLADVSADWYSPYNSHAWFEKGRLVKVSHSDYPVDPDRSFQAD